MEKNIHGFTQIKDGSIIESEDPATLHSCEYCFENHGSWKECYIEHGRKLDQPECENALALHKDAKIRYARNMVNKALVNVKAEARDRGLSQNAIKDEFEEFLDHHFLTDYEQKEYNESKKRALERHPEIKEMTDLHEK